MGILRKDILRSLLNAILLIYFLITLNNAYAFVKTTAYTSTGITNKDFVDMIREDLRRNNDDYKDLTTQMSSLNVYTGAGTHTTTVTTNNTTKQTDSGPEKLYSKKESKVINLKRNVVETMKDDMKRRAFDNVGSLNISDFIRKLKSSINKPNNLQNKKSIEINKVQNQTALSSTLTLLKGFSVVTDNDLERVDSSKYTLQLKNKEKIEKVKMFLEKNKEPLREFIRNKDQNTQIISMRATDTSSDENVNVRALPDQYQLDMSPAKGARINAMRVKGRLCQRSVLFPEGPKYDSKGLQYLPAHVAADVRGRDFANTRAPALVLPRCCNCCRKSVLGCE